MKRRAGFLALLILPLLCVGAFAQTSDYEIIETYKTKHQTLLESIRAVQDLERCETLQDEIGSLEAAYQRQRALLAEGLYPETLATSIGALRDQLEKAKARISAALEIERNKATIQEITLKAEASERTIQELGTANESLTQEVGRLSAQIQQLSEANATLLGQIKGLQQQGQKDRETIAQLKALTEKLHANIRDRDDLIVQMVDSMLKEYAKPSLTDAQKSSLFVNVQTNDYVGKIAAAIDANMQYAENTMLGPQDVELLRNEHRKLASTWGTIRPHVEKIYPDDRFMTRDITTVDGSLSTWKSRIDESAWRSMHQVFVGQNVDIGPFGNAAEFRAQLLAYVDERIKAPSRAGYRLFRSKVWDSPMKDQWLPVIPTEELTAEQRAEIDERIALWDKKVAALVWRWVLIGLIGLAAFAAVVAVALRRRQPAPPAS